MEELSNVDDDADVGDGRDNLKRLLPDDGCGVSGGAR